MNRVFCSVCPFLFPKALLFVCFCFGFLDLYAQEQLIEQRSFAKINAYFEKVYEGTPVKGNHKRFLREKHFQKSHLDKDGRIFNHTLANFQAAQQFYIDTFPAEIQGDWEMYGPQSVIRSEYAEAGIGRVNCVAVASASVWYAGTAGGGLWRSNEAGDWDGFGDYPWYPLTDSLPSLSISGIAVHPNDVDDVYILTGDGEGINFATNFANRGNHPGIGILHSTNGGTSWSTTSLQYGMTQLNAGYKLGMYPGDPNSMLAACTDGLYRTTDSWNTNFITQTGLCYDFEFKPGDPQTIYAAFGGSLRRSVNGGSTFQNITLNLDNTNISIGNMGRMELAVSPNNANVLYVIISINNFGQTNHGGLMSFQISTDGGDSFIEIINNSFNILAADDPSNTPGGQGNYDLALWVDPNDANIVLVGGVNIWRLNGGFWTEVMHWTNEPIAYTHADIHGLESNLFTGEIIACTDGGLYASSNGGTGWLNRGRGMGITQYYHFDVYSTGFGSPSVTAGAQDNGTQYGLGDVANVFEMIGGGDGFRTFRGSDDGEVVRYRSVQNGKLYRQQLFSGGPLAGEFWGEAQITPDDQLNGDDTGRGIWDTPYKTKFFNINEILAGYNNLYFSDDGGDDWVILPVNHPNGTYDNSKNISQIEWARNTGNLAYFMMNDSTVRHLWRCDALFSAVNTGNLNNGACMTRSLDTIAIMPNSTPTDIAMNPNTEDQVWLSFPGYASGMKVYYNQDFPADSPWVNITYNLPNVPVHCVEYDVDGMFVGTDIGAFFLPNGEQLWIYFSKGLPTVAVTEIEIHINNQGKKIWAATWGRGVWRSDPPVPVRRTKWFVDIDAVGLNSGANWTNAFTNLQTALDTIFPGDSILVAEGIYLPETINGFSLMEDHITIIGGFNGTELNANQRDFDLNETILSGDLGVVGDSLDNAYHVFKFNGLNIDVLLDGFHITKGNARGIGENANGGGIYYSNGPYDGKPIIRNCQFYNNTAGVSNTGLGGAIYIGFFERTGSDFIIERCSFENNLARNKGGAIYLDAFNQQPLYKGAFIAQIKNCSFKKNTANFGGGAIYSEAVTGSKIQLHIDSSFFEDNRLIWFHASGAGIYNYAHLGSIIFTCSNSVFQNHTYPGGSNGGGTAIMNDGGPGTTADGNIVTVLNNCLFNANVGATGAAIYDFMQSSTSVFVMTQCTLINNVGHGGPAVYLNARNGANHISSFSKCIFADNTSTSNGVFTLNGEYSGVMDVQMDSCIFLNNQSIYGGALEVYGRIGPSGLGDIDLAISNSEFNNNTATQFGGAIRLLSSGGDIQLDVENTKFSDNLAKSGGAVYHQHTVNGNSNLTANYTGCTFTKNTTPLIGAGQGGALYYFRSNGTLTNCNFIENKSGRGGAIYNYNYLSNHVLQQKIEYTNFIKNEAFFSGGAIYNNHVKPAILDLEILNCSFDSNYTSNPSTDGWGAAIFSLGTGRSMEYINNSSFTRNRSVKNGGAIYATGVLNASSDTTFLTVENTDFTNNDAGITGETIYLNAVYSDWNNSHFYNDETGVMFNHRVQSGLSLAKFTNCTFNKLFAPMPLPPAARNEQEPLFPIKKLKIKKGGG